MKVSMIKSIKSFSFKLWCVLSAAQLVPAIYQTIRVYFLGDLETDSGINIASQMQWVSCIYEILQEGLLVPMFYLLGHSLKDSNEMTNKIRGFLIVISVVFLIVTVIVISAAYPLVRFMAINIGNMIDQTISYIRLESIAIFLGMYVQIGRQILTFLRKEKDLLIILILEMILSILFDTFFLSSLSVSAKLGVNGIAYSKITTYFILTTIIFLILHFQNIKIFKLNSQIQFSWMKEWVKVGGYAGAESLLRNLAFMMMVVRMMNEVGEQGTYWIANTFIWNWLLIPFNAIGSVVNKDVAEKISNINSKTLGYIIMTIILIIIEACTIPSWGLFIKKVLNTNSYSKVIEIMKIVALPYITFVFNNIMDNTFKGCGKTHYLLIQSLCIDGAYYLIMFILYISKTFKPTLGRVSFMFGGGMVLDLIPSTVLYWKLLHDKKLNIFPIADNSDDNSLSSENDTNNSSFSHSNQSSFEQVY